jgi:hypothetical protein
MHKARKTEAGVAALAMLMAAAPAVAVMWYPVANDEMAIVSMNQETLIAKGNTVSAEFQYVFKKTLTLPYADDARADTFRRMKTWVEVDCVGKTLRVLERTLLGEKGDTVADGVPASLKSARPTSGLDPIETTMLRVACGGIQAAD